MRHIWICGVVFSFLPVSLHIGVVSCASREGKRLYALCLLGERSSGLACFGIFQLNMLHEMDGMGLVIGVQRLLPLSGLGFLRARTTGL